MSMKTLMVRGAVGLGAFLTLSLPAASLAATPQQIIDKGLSNMAFTTPSLSSGDVKVTMTDRVTNKRAPVGTAAVTLVVKERKLPKAGQAIPDTDGTIIIKKVEGTGTNAIPTVSNPGTIEFRIVNSVGYVRVKEVSDAVRAYLALKGVDANTAVGTWVKIDPKEICAALGSSCTAVAGASSVGISASSDIVKMKPIVVTGVEKRWTAKNGDKMVRVRARASSAIVTKLLNAEIAKIAKNDKQRVSKIAALRKQYASMQKELAAVRMAINVNQTKGTVDRVEAATTQVTPKQTCTTNAKTKKQVCRTTGSQTVNLLAGMNVSGGSVTPVMVPESSVSAVSLASSALLFLPQ
jgi:hypothetical protein